jgi:hypothetical protein
MRLPGWVWWSYLGVGLFLEAVAIATEARGDTATENLVVVLPAWAGLGLLALGVWHFAPRFWRHRRDR